MLILTVITKYSNTTHNKSISDIAVYTIEFIFTKDSQSVALYLAITNLKSLNHVDKQYHLDD